MTLQALRKAKNLTLVQLSELCGISDGRLGQWESWNRLPRSKSARNPELMSVQSARHLAAALDVSIDTLVAAISND